MALSQIDKLKLNKYVKGKALGHLYYREMQECLNKKEKVSDIELLDYFVTQLFNELSSDNKLYFNYLVKLIYIIDCFLSILSHDNVSVDDEILDKIRSLSDLYNEYLKRTNSLNDEEFAKNLTFIVAQTNKFYPTMNNEKVHVYIKQINELKFQLSELSKKQKDIIDLYELSKKDYEKTREHIKGINQDKELYQNELNKKNIKIKTLEEEMVLLKKNIDSLEQEINLLKKENIKIPTLKKDFDELNEKYCELREFQIKVINDEIINKQKIAKKNELIKLIYEKLLLESLTYEELVSYLKSCVYATCEDIDDALLKLQRYININNNVFMTKPTYRIKKPNTFINNDFFIEIPNNKNYYDVVLVADFHLKEINKNTLNWFKILNRYCSQNSIDLVLNLGDLFDIVGNLNYKEALNNYQFVEQIRDKVPFEDGIYHAILGGNHDANMLKYGFDPLDMLAERKDFLSLGYNNRTIAFVNKEKELLGRIGLHHPDIYNFYTGNFLKVDEKCVLEYLEKLPDNQKKEIYFHLFGHFHRPYYDLQNAYSLLPQYSSKHFKKACHMRLYFANEKIAYIMFMPLVGEEVLYKDVELVYQKKKTI